MKIENARWNENKYIANRPKRKQMSKSVKALMSMKVDQVKRIIHDDVACHECGKISCTLVSTISRLKRRRIIFQHYHEDTSVMFVKRVR